MPDDRSIRGPADRSRINVNEAYEVAYWAKEFGCTPSYAMRSRRLDPWSMKFANILGDKTSVSSPVEVPQPDDEPLQ
jgi:hypothetical protein